jgi:hypothetical protein
MTYEVLIISLRLIRRSCRLLHLIYLFALCIRFHLLQLLLLPDKHKVIVILLLASVKSTPKLRFLHVSVYHKCGSSIKRQGYQQRPFFLERIDYLRSKPEMR